MATITIPPPPSPLPSPPPPSPPPPPPSIQCTLDFLTYEHGHSEPVPGQDGNLVAEIALMARISRDTALLGTIDPLACRIADDAVFQCLDIGAPSTLGGFVDPSAFNALATGDSAANLALGATVGNATNAKSTLFGQTQLCGGKRVGDGIVNIFDIATAMAWIFRELNDTTYLPVIPGLIPTIEGRPGLAEACGGGVPKREYMESYASDVCFRFGASIEKRRLSGARRVLYTDNAPFIAPEALETNVQGEWPLAPPPPPMPPGGLLFGTTPTRNQSLSTRMWIGTLLQSMDATPGRVAHLSDVQIQVIQALPQATGTWHTLLTGAVVTRLEVVFMGLRREATGRLSFAEFDGGPPPETDRVTVRYTRYCEYTDGGCDGTCALIDSAGSTALREGTLSLMQATLMAACPFDVHIWVPHWARDPARCMGVDYITAANGDSGVFNGQSTCSRTLATLPPGPPPVPTEPPPPVLPPPLLPPPPPPPTMRPCGGWGGRWLAVVLLLALLIACAPWSLKTVARVMASQPSDGGWSPGQPERGG
jgi:hypothetical protein